MAEWDPGGLAATELIIGISPLPAEMRDRPLGSSAARRHRQRAEKGQQSQKQAYNKYKDSKKGKEAILRAVKAYRERQKALKASQGLEEKANDNN